MEDEDSPLTDWDSCCRTCMGSSVAMFGVYSKCNEDIIADLLNTLAHIVIDTNDDLPKLICATCYNKLKDFTVYISQATAVEAKRRSLVKLKELQKTEDKKIEIKVKINQHQINNGIQINDCGNMPEPTQCLAEDSVYDLKSKKKQYTCDLCFVTFSRLLSLKEHKTKIHQQVNLKCEFTCNACNKTFKTNSTLTQHKLLHLPKTHQYPCQHCPESFKRHTLLNKHILLKHEANDDAQNSSDEEAEPEIKRQLEILTCNFCQAKFKSQQALAAHMRKHVKPGRVLACSVCSKKFKRASHVKRHERTHGINLPFKCSVCPQSFYSEYMLLWHMNKQHEGSAMTSQENQLSQTKEDQQIKIKIEPEQDQATNDDVQNNDSDDLPQLEHDSDNLPQLEHDSDDLPQLEHDSDDLPELGYDAEDDKPLMVLKKRKPRFTCDICFENFSRHVYLKEHKANIHPEANLKCVFTCDVCNRVFKSNSKLSRHQLMHKSKNYQCQCPHCPKSYKQQSLLDYHVFFKHGPQGEMEDDAKPEIKAELEVISCNLCQETFQSQHSLVAHKRKHIKPGRVLACSICSKEFKKLSHLKRHELTHEVNRPFKCSECPKSFYAEDMLIRHMDKQHRGKPGPGSQFTCAYCSKDFGYMSSLREHIKIHMGLKAYLCPTCGKRFHTSGNLKQHLRRHTGEKPFFCDMCPKKFISKGELMGHRVTHTGEKRFKCNQCDSAFTMSHSLLKHKRKHLGVKPYECDVCSMRFNNKSHLQRHYRIHTGEKPYRCDLCERTFTQSADLLKHKRSHLGEKIYKCNQCTDSFRLKSELTQHLTVHYLSSKLESAGQNTEAVFSASPQNDKCASKIVSAI